MQRSRYTHTAKQVFPYSQESTTGSLHKCTIPPIIVETLFIIDAGYSDTMSRPDGPLEYSGASLLFRQLRMSHRWLSWHVTPPGTSTQQDTLMMTHKAPQSGIVALNLIYLGMASFRVSRFRNTGPTPIPE